MTYDPSHPLFNLTYPLIDHAHLSALLTDPCDKFPLPEMDQMWWVWSPDHTGGDGILAEVSAGISGCGQL